MAPRLSCSWRGGRAPEPASRRPLRWGHHGDRALVGAGLVGVGAALVASADAFSLGLGLVGSVLHVAGWLVQPARPRTRVAAALVGLAACWCAIGGAPAMWALAALLPCWLAVRGRPGVTWLLTAVPLAVGAGLGAALPYVADKPVVGGATGLAVVLCALVAREVALRVRIRLVHGRSMARTPPPGAPGRYSPSSSGRTARPRDERGRPWRTPPSPTAPRSARTRP